MTHPRRDGRTVYVVDRHGDSLGYLVTEGTGVVAHSVRGRMVPFASWLKALTWLTIEGGVGA